MSRKMRLLVMRLKKPLVILTQMKEILETIHTKLQAAVKIV